VTEAGIRDLMKRSEDEGIEFKPKVITAQQVGNGSASLAGVVERMLHVTFKCFM
jgi:hypothetical protein